MELIILKNGAQIENRLTAHNIKFAREGFKKGNPLCRSKADWEAYARANVTNALGRLFLKHDTSALLYARGIQHYLENTGESIAYAVDGPHNVTRIAVNYRGRMIKTDLTE